jgi:SAM-dependent methyltransferase
LIEESDVEFSEAALQRVREDRLLIDGVDAWLFEEVAPYLGERVLEVGCGVGNFAQHLMGRALYAGIDVSHESVRSFNETYGTFPNAFALELDVCTPKLLELAHLGFDTVFSLNVLEHIADDRAALQNIGRVLRPGGMLVLVVPAHNWLYGSMDRSIGHHRRYDKRKMSNLLGATGFRCVAQKYINALGAVGWYVNGRILERETPPSQQLRVFNKVVPLLKLVERIVPVPFGISLLAVAERRVANTTQV